MLRRGGSGRGAATRLRSAGSVVGLPVAGRYLYPAFQFAADRAQVHAHVAEVNQLLDAARDPWGVASWWLSPSARVAGGRTPAELATDPDPDTQRRVLRLAQALLED